MDNGGCTFKKVSKYDQEISQSQTADKPMAPRGRATQQARDTHSFKYYNSGLLDTVVTE